MQLIPEPLEQLDPLGFCRVFRWRSIVAKPMMTLMLNMFEPKTFPTDNAAVSATVNSGSEGENAIRLKLTAVFPCLEMERTMT